MSSAILAKQTRDIRTCDACKFRHQKCDGTRPVCRNCSSRRLKCLYTGTPASVVQRPEPIQRISFMPSGQTEGRTGSTPREITNPTTDVDDESSTTIYGLQTKITHLLALPPEKSEQLRRILCATSLPSAHTSTASLLPGKQHAEYSLQESLTDHIETIRNRDEQTRSPLPTQSLSLQALAKWDDTEGTGHVSTINPFRFYAILEVKQLLATFIQRVNSIFYFFKKGDLENYFDMVTETTSSFPNQIMCELCLALALGAQTSNSESADKTIMWYENGRRYLDNDNWKNKLWVMRAMTLISIFHIEERSDTSGHYLSIATSIGQANLLNHSMQGTDADTFHWLHVWHTVTFLNRWLRLTGTIIFREPTGLEPATDSQEGEQFPAINHEGYIVPRNMIHLGDSLHHIIKDVYLTPGAPLSKYEIHMRELQVFVAQLPEELQCSTATQISNMSNERKFAIVHLHTMRLGSIVVLTRPMLLKTVNAFVEQLSLDRTLEFGTEEFAHVCIESASDLVSLSEKAFRADSFPRRSWLLVYFLFDAALISVLGIIWQQQLERTSPTHTSRFCLQRGKSAVAVAIQILQYCGSTNRVARQYWIKLVQFKLWIEGM